jgi:cytochrome c oxidase subunit 2
MIFVVIVQVARMNDLMNDLRDQDKVEFERDRVNGILMIAFLVLFMGGIYYSLMRWLPTLLPESASLQGQWIDVMFNITLVLTGIDFVATQVALFVFSFQYRHKKGGKAYFYPENNVLEMWWTIVPAIVLTGLVIVGIFRWFQITTPAYDKNTMVLEIAGKQFNWMLRYPGKDGKLGHREFKYVDETNGMGVDFSDPTAKDDFMANEMHIVVNRPVNIKIWARDVIHNVGMPHFRMKMDAMPGIPTQMTVTPIITTAEMRKKTNNPDFNYEIACDQLCGKGHFAMKMNVVVETQEEFDKWAAQQQSFYESQIKGTDEEKKFLHAAAATNTPPSVNNKLASKL